MGSNAQYRYWTLLKELRGYVIYFQKYAARSERYDNTINIFLTVTSCSGITAWTIWEKYHIVWAVIVAISQFITAIKPFIPYQKRIKAISELNANIQELSLDCENGWIDVSEGKLSENKINDLYRSLNSKLLKADIKYLNSLTLPEKSDIKSEAGIETDLYLQKFYYPGDPHEQT